MTRLHPHPLPIVARLHEAIRISDLDDLRDADLLDRFARFADHPAFEVLLQRHGPMVLGVCRRALSNSADVEDAFQATFLVLVRKARTLTRGDRLGPWLYGVAYRVALKARCRAAQIAVRRSEVTDMIPDSTPSSQVADWLPILDAELNALPAKYRDPLVLCELQGTSRADAARALKIPEGTLSSRLARGRNLLRNRLLKHGTLLPAGGLTTMFAASGVGRATVPAALLARTSKLAEVVATGATATGVVPVAIARLMDEVVKNMFLTKLRLAGGAILAAGLIAVGILAVLPAAAPGQQQEQKPGVKATSAPPLSEVPRKDALNDRIRSDREAMQGLWTMTVCAWSKRTEKNKDALESLLQRNMQFLISGDVLWGWCKAEKSGPAGGILMPPLIIKIDPTKNPKWLDLYKPAGKDQISCIYELEGDKLSLCMCDVGSAVRPAEFTIDAENGITVMEFERNKMPLAAGDQALTGLWDDSKLVILDGFLFAYVPDHGGEPTWIGGRYSVDITKNPKWIDIDLLSPYPNQAITKLYGSYEVDEGHLKMALGLTGKRSIRPLDLKATKDVLIFDVKPISNAHPKPIKNEERTTRPGVIKTVDVPTRLPGMNDKGWPFLPPGLIPNLDEDDENEHVNELIKNGKYDQAESYLREHLANSKGLQRAWQLLQLCICLVQRAGNAKPTEAEKLREEGLVLARQIIKEVDGDRRDRATWLQRQAELRVLQILQQSGKPAEVLAEATPLVEKYAGTVDELIVRSIMFNAYKQKGDSLKVSETFEAMKYVFDHLPASAFTATSGEYSRAFWVKSWFNESVGVKH